MKNACVRIKGIVPLLMNRYPGEKPTETKPRKKTAEWLEAQRKARWMEASHFADNQFHLPGDMIEGALFKAAAAFRKQTDFKLSVMVVESFVPLLVDRGKGPHPLEGELEKYYMPEFIDIRGVMNRAGQMVEQCRPIFRTWAAEFTVRYDEMAVNTEDVKRALAGMILGSFRPRFGRVAVEKFQVT